ncbi:MAG: hypothetical protein N3G74_00235 [Candidatus Micrarchaeota archaeon]|nr:hypothetical protein [Candidatus Micrarchaeota archaeon]
MAIYKINNNRVKDIDPEKSEHHMNITKVQVERMETKEKIKRFVKRAAVATAIGASIFVLSKSLKAEDAIVSSQPAVIQSTETALPATAIKESTTTSIIKKISNLLSIKPKVEECVISDNKENNKKYTMQEILVCLSSQNEVHVSNAISELFNREIVLNRAVRSKIAELVLSADLFEYPRIMEITKIHRIDEAIPNIIKRLNSDSAALDPMFNDSLPALGFFAVKGDWNAINKLLEIVRTNPDDDVRALTAACLLYIDKNVMQDVINAYNSLPENKRDEFIKHVIKIYGFDLWPNKVHLNKETFNKRIDALKRIEKNDSLISNLENAKLQ